MYSKSSWGGPVDPFILVKFTDVGKDQGDDPVVSLLIFDWMDEDYIGVVPEGRTTKVGVCEQMWVDAGLCDQADIGKFILAPNATEESVNLILTKAVHLKDSAPVKYSINKTGYFCVVTDKFTATKYQAVVEFRNAYGELSAAQIPKLPFYGGITIAYALLLVYVDQGRFYGLRTDGFAGSGASSISSIDPTSVCGFPPAARVIPLTVCSACAELHNGNPHCSVD
jgi:hypothetical protein